MVIAAFAVWSFISFVRIADERQARINYQALGFAFILALAVSLFCGFARGFRAPHVSWLGVLGLLPIPWSLGLIVFSWRYR
jgi:cadmium resistance protein CadD (predicted permease)